VEEYLRSSNNKVAVMVVDPNLNMQKNSSLMHQMLNRHGFGSVSIESGYALYDQLH
jgi:hypothetical protein